MQRCFRLHRISSIRGGRLLLSPKQRLPFLGTFKQLIEETQPNISWWRISYPRQNGLRQQSNIKSQQRMRIFCIYRDTHVIRELSSPPARSSLPDWLLPTPREAEHRFVCLTIGCQTTSMAVAKPGAAKKCNDKLPQ